jgi:hypothetical protein
MSCSCKACQTAAEGFRSGKEVQAMMRGDAMVGDGGKVPTTKESAVDAQRRDAIHRRIMEGLAALSMTGAGLPRPGDPHPNGLREMPDPAKPPAYLTRDVDGSRAPVALEDCWPAIVRIIELVREMAAAGSPEQVMFIRTRVIERLRDLDGVMFHVEG